MTTAAPAHPLNPEVLPRPGDEAHLTRPRSLVDDRDWPHTRRLLPWSLAAFLAMVWLVPFDSVQFPFGLPIDAKLDRLALVGLGGVCMWALLRGERLNHQPNVQIVPLAILAFVAIALASIAINAEVLAQLAQLDLATKKLALLAANLTFFVIVAKTVRPSEVRNFIIFTIGLAAVTGIGTVWEYRFDYNAFFDWADKLLPSPIKVAAPPPDPWFERKAVTGPTTVGLAVTTMLACAAPFAIVEFARSSTRRQKVLYALALGLILAGVFATIRKSAGVLPIVVLATLLIYRPRLMFRLVPLGLVLVFFIQGLAPGALVTVKAQILGNGRFQTTSTEDRKADYPAVAPDVKKHPLFGRGYGTYDHKKYRVLDNQYLVLLIEVGVFGLLAFLLIVFFGFVGAHRLAQSGDRLRGPPALAALAAIVVFGVSNVLYDALAFAQVPYLFFFVLGLTAVLALPDKQRDERAIAARPEPIPQGSPS